MAQDAHSEARLWIDQENFQVVLDYRVSGSELASDLDEFLAVAQEWRDKARFAVTSGMAFDDAATDGWCQHLRFEDLMRDPIAAVRTLYAQYGETPTPLHERRMQVWLSERGRDSEGRHVYDPSDFGWSYDELASEFEDYSKRYDISRESAE